MNHSGQSYGPDVASDAAGRQAAIAARANSINTIYVYIYMAYFILIDL